MLTGSEFIPLFFPFWSFPPAVPANQETDQPVVRPRHVVDPSLPTFLSSRHHPGSTEPNLKSSLVWKRDPTFASHPDQTASKRSALLPSQARSALLPLRTLEPTDNSRLSTSQTSSPCANRFSILQATVARPSSSSTPPPRSRYLLTTTRRRHRMSPIVRPPATCH